MFTRKQQDEIAEILATAIERCRNIAIARTDGIAPAFNNSRFGIQIVEEVFYDHVSNPDAFSVKIEALLMDGSRNATR